MCDTGIYDDYLTFDVFWYESWPFENKYYAILT